MAASHHVDAEPPTPHDAFQSVSGSRVLHIVETLTRPGACVVLTGEPGCGKAYLARSAALSLIQESSEPLELIVIDSVDRVGTSHRDFQFVSSEEEDHRALEDLAIRAGADNVLLVALNIDRFSHANAVVLERIAQAGRLRMVCTAQSVTGAADRLARNPRVHQLAVEPLTEDEAEGFLARLWGVERVEHGTLSRWYAATRGNQHALMTLALCAHRGGIVHKARSIGWVSPQDDQAPSDFVTQLGELSPTERASLELIAFASPLHEPALLQLLSSVAVGRLIDRHVVTVRTETNGITALMTMLPILTQSVLNSISPLRRTALAAQCFRALSGDRFPTPRREGSRSRMVRFGLEGACDVPLDWVWTAMRCGTHDGDLKYRLKLALVALSHNDPRKACEAIQIACDLAYFLGDREALEVSLEAAQRFRAEPEHAEAVEFSSWSTLAIMTVTADPEFRGYPDRALAALDEWGSTWQLQGRDASRAIESTKMRILSLHGALAQAFEVGTQRGGIGIESMDIESEFLSAPARTYESLLRIQRGEFSLALTLAEHTRNLVMLHERSPSISGGLEGLAIFLAHWSRGTTQSAFRTIELILAPPHPAIQHLNMHTGFEDLAIALLALQEGRWNAAADYSTRLTTYLQRNDPFGVLPLAHAISALSLAALGDADAARNAIELSRAQTPGLSQTLRGFKELFVIRAQHWLRDDQLIQQASELVLWAKDEGLTFIELSVLDIIAYEVPSPHPAILTRATKLAARVDAPIGEAVLDHIRSLISKGSGDTQLEERLLSELGVWLPLPPVEQLTAREREIALFTSLGYSSKLIAERLHLSVRTVETHLSHVYAKLGISNREQLRQWFSTNRTANDRPTRLSASS